MKLIVVKKIKLEDLDAGKLFLSEDKTCLALKSEYKTNAGAVEAYIVGSGEMFWGGTSDPSVQSKLPVWEVRVIQEDDVDIYEGDLNKKRINAYTNVAYDYNVGLGTVRDIFNAGAEWILNHLKK